MERRGRECCLNEWSTRKRSAGDGKDDMRWLITEGGGLRRLECHVAGGTGEKLRWRRAAEAIRGERGVSDIAQATKCAQYWQEVGVFEAIDVWCDR